MRNLFTFGTLFLLNTSMVFCQAPQTFSWQGDLFQYYTVPTTGYYFMQARGGQGGPVDTYSGGKGAHVQGYFFLEAGDFLIIAAAGQGARGELGKQDQGNNFWFGAGGGGASSVVKQIKPNWYTYEYTPLLIAGGGGGAYGGDSCAQCSSPAAEGIGGSTSPYGIATGGPGGINGSGGGIGISEAGGAGGAGYSGNGGTHCIGACKPDFSDAFAVGGQAYINGNYGGGFQAYTSYGFGGWGGGGQGGFDATSAPGYTSGGGGGGGGYSGGSGGEANTGNISAGGGGGSLNTSICGQSDSSGVNEGNGFVTISGPNITTEVVNSLVNPYIWPANGVSYTASGSYVFTDSANCVTRILDLHFGLNSCTSYTRIDTTIISCGIYTNPLNGRTYTENTTDSIRVGCTKYVVRLFITAPELLMGNMITGSSAVSGLTNVGNNASSIPLSVCKNSTEIYSINPVPYATSYQWTLPSGLTGTSTTSSITVQISNSFSGGDICVTPVNACGSGATMCRAITLLNTPPTGRLQITGPAAPFISGNYSVTPITGATSYIWSVSNNQAVIVSGQGTPNVQLAAQSGFTRANLSVLASNCKGNGSRGTLALKAYGNGPGAAAPARMSAVETEELSVYPNPTKGQFMLNTPSLETDATVEVYSVEGRLVHSQNIPANTEQTSIDLQQQASGLYQVRLVAGDEVRSVKVIVQ